MWIWKWGSTDGGDAGVIVQQAVSAGLHQLWVRVGDSMNGFYGANELDSLVPVAHAHGVAVIAWGFPYLWDPVGDAQWSAQILDWRAPDGQQVDGYSADIEEATEGVMLSAPRVAVYLELVRQAAGSRPVVATVYPPTDASWDGAYPYQAMAPYVDAFAPDDLLGVHRSRHRRRARRRSPLDAPTCRRHRPGLQLRWRWR